jgi:hypothetical protein
MRCTSSLVHILLLVVAVCAQDDTAVDTPLKYQKIEGKITFNKQWPAPVGNWQTHTRVLVNYGQLSAFVK